MLVLTHFIFYFFIQFYVVFTYALCAFYVMLVLFVVHNSFTVHHFGPVFVGLKCFINKVGFDNILRTY